MIGAQCHRQMHRVEGRPCGSRSWRDPPASRPRTDSARRATIRPCWRRRTSPGGRTHTEHFGPGHWSDDGAGWLGTFYPDTLALLDELGLRDRLRVLRLRGGGDLLIGDRLVANPNSVPRILTTDLLSPTEKLRFFTWMARLFLTQRDELPDRSAVRRDERVGRLSVGRCGRRRARGPAVVRGPVLLASRGAVGCTRSIVAARPVRRDVLPGRRWDGCPVAGPRGAALGPHRLDRGTRRAACGWRRRDRRERRGGDVRRGRRRGPSADRRADSGR